MRMLEIKPFSHPPTHLPLTFGPFNSSTQKRWRKPIDSAQTRLENRTRDLKLDKLMTHLKKLTIVLQIQHLMSNRRRGPFVSVQSVSRWKNMVGLSVNVGIGAFLRKYPHVFDVFTHPVRRNQCCRITREMADLVKEEEIVIKECELEAVGRLKKLLMMSKNATLPIHALRLIRKELGFPEDFRDSMLKKYTNGFKLIDLEIVGLIDGSDEENLGVVAAVEKWREKEYKEKWLSEWETRYAFPINLPTGFKIERGFRERLKNWQRLAYMKPYERINGNGTCGGVGGKEKRAVGIVHELLSLTVEKRVELDGIAHFRRDFGIEIINVRELLLKHPGIFYISTKANTQVVFLREAYSKGCLIEPHPIYVVRRRMMDFLLQGNQGRGEQTLQCGL